VCRSKRVLQDESVGRRGMSFTVVQLNRPDFSVQWYSNLLL